MFSYKICFLNNRMITQMLRRWGWREECKYWFTSLWRKKYEMISSCIMMTSYRMACIEQSHFQGKNPQWNWFFKKRIHLVFFLIYIFYWTLADLQRFRYTARWFSYTYIHILFFRLFSVIGYYKLLIIVPCESVSR